MFSTYVPVIETSLSDFHKLTVAQMKATFHKQQPKVLNYRNYKFFNNDLFSNDLLHAIHLKGVSVGCKQFQDG